MWCGMLLWGWMWNSEYVLRSIQSWAQLFILLIGAHVKRHDCVRSRSLPLRFLPHKDRQNAGQKIQLLASESKETQIHKFFFFLCTQTHKCAHADMYSSKSCWHTRRHMAESFTPSLKEKLKKISFHSKQSYTNNNVYRWYVYLYKSIEIELFLLFCHKYGKTVKEEKTTAKPWNYT